MNSCDHSAAKPIVHEPLWIPLIFTLYSGRFSQCMSCVCLFFFIFSFKWNHKCNFNSYDVFVYYLNCTICSLCRSIGFIYLGVSRKVLVNLIQKNKVVNNVDCFFKIAFNYNYWAHNFTILFFSLCANLCFWMMSDNLVILLTCKV